MPYIERLERKKKKRKNYVKNSESVKRRQEIYNTSKWRELRNGYFIQHPLCELCLQNGKTVAGEDVHHIISPFHQEDTAYFAYNPNNLLTLCKQCHSYIHKEHLEETLYNIFYERENI